MNRFNWDLKTTIIENTIKIIVCCVSSLEFAKIFAADATRLNTFDVINLSLNSATAHSLSMHTFNQEILAKHIERSIENLIE